MCTYMARAQFELATDERRRCRHAASAGFCPFHSWHYAEIASDVGIAVAYADVADQAGAQLASLVDASATLDELRRCAADLVVPPRRCPACRALAGAERAAVTAVTDAVRAQPDDRPPPPLCLPHLSAVLGADPGPDRGRMLVRAFADRWRARRRRCGPMPSNGTLPAAT
jgi:hypothetical protein